MTEEVQKHSVHTLVFRSLKRTHDMFMSDKDNIPQSDEKSELLKKMLKIRTEYGHVKDLPKDSASKKQDTTKQYSDEHWTGHSNDTSTQQTPSLQEGQIAIYDKNRLQSAGTGVSDSRKPDGSSDKRDAPSSKTMIVQIGQQQALVPRKAPTMPKPSWHPPWKLYRVISGHLGWVRCVAVEPGNQWFCTGSGDRMIKIWDLASGTLKLSLTGHVSSVRGLAVSPRNPYLFSCGEDKQVKCWDLEYNKVIRHYHGHLSACYALDVHPTIDVLVTCGRDSTARVWDMRTKACIHTLAGHQNTVASVKCQAADPQIITGSHDCTIRLWDLAAGRTRVTLTNHKKSIRSLALHPTQYTFGSASPDNIKQWKFPDGNFIQNLAGHNTILNALTLNSDNVLVSGGDNGSMYFWDWKTGYNFQRIHSAAQPGSIDSEAGIFAMTFDQSSTRLITCEADKTVKIYKEDETATEETHPLNWKPDILKKRKF